MRPISRFEATLNLACAAMTMLVCGALTGEMEDAIARPHEIVPLADEFSQVFSRRFGAAALRELVCPDLEHPLYYENFRIGKERLLFLRRTSCMPSTILAAVREEVGPDAKFVHANTRQGMYRRVGTRLSVDSVFISICWRHSFGVDLDEQWRKLRARLVEMARGAE